MLTVLEMQNKLINDHWRKNRESSKTFCPKSKTETSIFVFEAPRDPDFVHEDNITG